MTLQITIGNHDYFMVFLIQHEFFSLMYGFGDWKIFCGQKNQTKYG